MSWRVKKGKFVFTVHEGQPGHPCVIHAAELILLRKVIVPFWDSEQHCEECGGFHLYGTTGESALTAKTPVKRSADGKATPERKHVKSNPARLL